MKKLLLLIFLMLGTATYAQDGNLIASCCDATTTKTAKSFGRCSGDSSCTACKNCKYCKHCSKEGGSCGVCAPEPVKKVSGKKKIKQ